MSRKHPKTPRKGSKGGDLAPSTPPPPPSGGHAFAESALVGGLGDELTVRQVLVSMADITGLANPDPILRAEGKSISTYRKMVDGHLSSVMQKRFAAVRARPWSIERGSASARATARLQTIFDELDVREMTYQFMTATGMGYSVQGSGMEASDWIVPVRVVDRPQEWFTFGLRGETRFITDQGARVLVPPRKLLIARHRSDYLNPYGRPILSECFWPLAFKRGGLKFWMMFCEKFGLPKVVGKVPGSTADGEKLDLLYKLEAMVRAAAVVIPENNTVELLETKAGGALPFPELVKWADSEMSKAWLGETLSTEIQGTSGSRAAATVHNEVRADLALDDANLVESCMNELISWIWEINSLPGPMPRFVIQMPEDMQTGRLERDKGLYEVGARFTASYFTDTYGIAADHLSGVDNAPSNGSMAVRNTGLVGPSFAEPGPEAVNGEHVLKELFGELAPEELQGQIEQLVQPILDLADKSASFAEFEEKLDEIFPGLPFDKFQSAMTKCLLLAETRGRMDAHD